MLIFAIMLTWIQKCVSGGGGEGADQGGSDKIEQFKIEGRGSGPAVPPSDPRVHRGFGKKMGFFKFY